MSRRGGCKRERAGPNTHLPVVVYMRERSSLSACPLPSVTGERPGPGVMRSGELSLPFISCSIQERGPCSHLLSPMAGRKADPKVIRTGQLSLPLTHCSTQESRPYASARLSSTELALDVEGAGELAPRV